MLVRKNKIVKAQQGTVLPSLASYTPMLPPSSDSTTTTVKQSGAKASDSGLISREDLNDLTKKALPSDMRLIMSKYNQMMNIIDTYGDEMDEMFPNVLNGLYAEIRSIANRASIEYDNAKRLIENIEEKGVSSEYAQDSNGKLYYIDKDGKARKCDISDADGKALMTYNDLYNYRKSSIYGIFDDDAMSTLANPTSMEDVMKSIDSIANQIGRADTTSSTYTAKRNNQIAQGLEGILSDARNGIYKITESTSGTPKQYKIMAVNAILSNLPRNQRNYITLKAKMADKSPQEMLYEIIALRDDTKHTISIDKDVDLDEEEAEARAKKGSDGTRSGIQTSINPVRALNERLGEKTYDLLSFGQDNNYVFRLATNTTRFMPKYNDKTGMMKVSGLLEGDNNYSGILDWKNASFAGSNIDYSDLGEYVINDNAIRDVYLPYKYKRNDKGAYSIVPDFDLFSRLEQKDAVLEEMGIGRDGVNQSNYEAVNEELKKRNIDVQLDSNGKPVGDYIRFALINTMTGRDTFNKLSGPQQIYEVLADDDKAKQVAVTTGVEASGGGLFSDDEVIKGTIFVPVVENPVSATASSGEPIKVKEDVSVEQIKFNESRINRKPYVKPE